MMSGLENVDVMLGSPHFDEIDTENRSAIGNSEIREDSLNENEIRTYNRAAGHRKPDVSETPERKLEAIANEMNPLMNTKVQRARDDAIQPNRTNPNRAANVNGPSEGPDTNAGVCKYEELKK